MRIPIRKIFIFLIILITGLLVIHSVNYLIERFLGWNIADFITVRFNVNGESNVPSWFSTVLLFSISLTSIIIYWIGLRLPQSSTFRRVFWLGFGSAFCLFSLDETVQIHEIIDKFTPLKWVFVYAPFVGIFFLVCVYYFFVVRRVDKGLRNWIIGGLVVYAIGGLGLEWVSYTFDLKSAFQQIEYVMEEGLEMIGTAMVFYGCLQEFNRCFEAAFQAKDVSSKPDAELYI